MEEIRLWIAPIASLVIAIGGAFVMRSHVFDLRVQGKEHDVILRGDRGVLVRLEGLERDHASHTENLKDTIRRLEKVTGDLQQLTRDLGHSR